MRNLKLQTPNSKLQRNSKLQISDFKFQKLAMIEGGDWGPGFRQRCSAFTLIELVISASLMAMILAAAYLCLSAAISGQKLIEPRAELLQNARVAMAMLSADLRSACPLAKDLEFLVLHRILVDVETHNLEFATPTALPR